MMRRLPFSDNITVNGGSPRCVIGVKPVVIQQGRDHEQVCCCCHGALGGMLLPVPLVLLNPIRFAEDGSFGKMRQMKQASADFKTGVALRLAP